MKITKRKSFYLLLIGLIGLTFFSLTLCGITDSTQEATGLFNNGSSERNRLFLIKLEIPQI